MKLVPLGKNIIFTFVEDTSNGGFVPNIGGKIILKQNMDHNREPKWGKVHLVGPEVNKEEIKVGEYILIESLQWTSVFEWEGAKYWKTDAMKVMCTSEVPVHSF